MPATEALDGARRDRQVQAMWVLGGWGAASVAAGAALHLAAESERGRAFGQLSAGFGAVNLLIAGLAGPATAREHPTADAVEARRRARSIERALLFNAGLDVAYLVAGGWLWEHGARTESDRNRGFGQALVVQGAALFAFDLAVFFALSGAAEGLRVGALALPDASGLALGGRF